MKRDIVGIAAFFLVAGIIYWYFDDQKREIALQPLKKSIIASQHPLVLHFYADRSAPSKAFDPILKNTLRPYENTINCRDLNIDLPENLKLLHNCNATGVPTTVIFDRKGNQVAKTSGFVRADELDKLLHEAVVRR